MANSAAHKEYRKFIFTSARKRWRLNLVPERPKFASHKACTVPTCLFVPPQATGLTT